MRRDAPREAAVRVLLVHGYEPSGHAAAASALEAAFEARGAIVSRVSIASDHHPRAGQITARGYHALLRAAPGLWGALYRSSAAMRAASLIRGGYLSLGGAARLRAGVKRAGADVVVCPQASVAAVLAQARRRGDLDVPVVSVLTDYGAHPFWGDPAADLVIAPAARTAAELAAAGVPPGRIRILGLPIHPVYAAPPSRAAARRALDLPSAAPVVLVSGGSNGLGDLDRTAAALLRESQRAFVLVLCGGNDRLRRGMCALREAGGRLRVFGPQPPAFVAVLLAAADAHVGKPGGLTAAEGLALGVPMVLSRPLPGQEQANARYLLDAGAAVFGGDPAQAARRGAELLLDRLLLASLRANALGAGRPGAAAAIAAAVVEFAGSGIGSRIPTVVDHTWYTVRPRVAMS